MAIWRFNLIPRSGLEPTVRIDICESAVLNHFAIKAFCTFRNNNWIQLLFRKVQNAFIAKWLSTTLSQSVDTVSKLWEDIFTTFPVNSRSIRFEYIARCILTAYTANCDEASEYNSRLSTAHKARVALGGNNTITVDDDFSQTEMMRGLP
jgi:hypothetical protein